MAPRNPGSYSFSSLFYFLNRNSTSNRRDLMLLPPMKSKRVMVEGLYKVPFGVGDYGVSRSMSRTCHPSR